MNFWVAKGGGGGLKHKGQSSAPEHKARSFSKCIFTQPPIKLKNAW
jgi:hypothetical protein